MPGVKTIGIIGGGQLGRMLTLAAKPLGFEVIVIDSGKNCPAAQVGAQEITASLHDSKAIRKLSRLADVITVEIEHLNADVLRQLEAAGKPVHPSAATIKLVQDKLTQNQFLKASRLPIADFRPVENEEDVKKALSDFGRCLLKSRFGGYDGRGNALVKSTADIKPAFKKLGEAAKYVEKFVPFTKELAVMVARDRQGKTVSYGVVETVHKDNICHVVSAPAFVSHSIKRRAQRLAERAVKKLQGAGMFGVEMFLTKNSQVLINEIAPRVHNSGHHTLDSCVTSQFEQHLRAISDLPLGNPKMKVPAAVMINILGERNGPVRLRGRIAVLAMNDVHLHLYGKSPTKVARKMGHITAVADTIEAAKRQARAARRKLDI